MSDRRQGVAVRSYRDVVDVVERRIFRIDRWRLPTPHGVPVRAIGYALAILGLVLLAGVLPPIGPVLEAVPPSVRYVALPAIGGWALQAATLDGRPPHHVLFAATRHRLGARTLAGLRRAPEIGSQVAPVEAIQIAPSGDEPRYRSGRVVGPATVVLRYPAEVEVARRRRVRVRARKGAPLVRGYEIEVADGGEVVFE